MAIDFEGVGEAAGLRAFPAVGAASAQNLTRQALSRVSDAKSSVDEDLQGKAGGVGGGREFGQFPEGKLPGKDGQMKALATGEGDTLWGGQGHLGGGVERDVWANGLG